MPQQKKRPCSSCGEDLNLWGDRRGECPDCARAKRETVIPCAGRCGNSLEMRYMEVMNLVFNPGKKGGKTFKIHYCSRCHAAAKSRAGRLSDLQKKEIEKTVKRCKAGRVDRRKEKQ